MPAFFRRAAILGTGLIGGSFALALRRSEPRTTVVGWDQPEVLREAERRGAIHEGAREISTAVADADLIYISLPVGMAIEVLPEVARSASPEALVTDTCSTKRWVCAAAAECFDDGARFLGAHPMAGKEVSGIAAAAADLFRGAKYALIRGGSAEADAELRGDARVGVFLSLIESMGAMPAWLDAATHDQAAAMVSHLPQLLSVALANVVHTHTDGAGFPLSLAGGGLRDALRVSGSPYSMWRNILRTNSDHLDRALAELIEQLQLMRGALEEMGREPHSGALRQQFAVAGELYKMLRGLQDK